ncbi:microsomal triacylglycerol transfer protein isoform X2 [Bacillus rossius redtenbacheri]|uniref:microsomal triacylglycerol transfer protein isoform X2 n=1 Tax=Bacillus rossius redtenbacheri TaxID=93214 RepID=UPI002FDE9755
MLDRAGIVSIFWLLALFAAAGGGSGRGQLWEAGEGRAYRLETTVLLNDARGGRDVGFRVTGVVTAGCVWQGAGDKLLRLELTEPQLHIKSRKAPAPEGFVAHSSALDGLDGGVFLAHWRGGRLEHVYLAQGEPPSLANLKKGVAGLFQFQTQDTELTEKDASGKCEVTYKTIDKYTFEKTKTSCVSGKKMPYILHPDQLMGAAVRSRREARYVLTPDMSALQSAVMEESHEMTAVLREEAGNVVWARQEIVLTDSAVTMLPVSGDTVDEAVRELEATSGRTYQKQSLVLDREAATCQEDCPSLAKLVKENRGHLLADHLGTSRSAAAFIRLLGVARQATKEEIKKVLKSSKNGEIVQQLSDLVGATQTAAAHQAAMSTLQLGSDDSLDRSERYLWSLSLGSHPHQDVIRDVLTACRKHSEALEAADDGPGSKLAETLLLTVAAMANRFARLPGNEDHKLVGDVKSFLEAGLADCKGQACRQRHLRALRNLRHEATIPTLLRHALDGAQKTSVAAMKAVRSFPPASWSDHVKKAAEQIFFQVGRKYDSSSRTLSLDVLLESEPRKELLRDLLRWLTQHREPAYEVKQYLLQRLRQLGERGGGLADALRELERDEGALLRNYHALAQRGLSTAFTRPFLRHPSANGSLLTVQEVSGGLLKRGVVDIVLERHGTAQEMFSLGLFAGGMGSFISSDDDEPAGDDEPEEPANAGMEVVALGVQVRPFVFFSGQGDLMGHVWSGTASEKTPAFQMIALLQDHLEYIPLQTGFVAELSLVGAVSFDLSGQIQLSLWYKTAHSLVEKNAGIFLQGLAKVDSSFVRSQAEFTLATEAKLNLESDVSFSDKVAMCMQLKQPDSVIRHNVYKVERIPGSKHRLRKSKYKVIQVAGRTYALNQKNNEMCGVIHST